MAAIIRAMGRVLRFWSLPAGDRLLLVAFGMALPVLDFGLRLFGFGRVYRALRRATARATPSSLPEAEIERYERLLRMACRQAPSSGRCLPRSLALWYVLRRKGMSTVLRIGTRPRASQLEGHAWLKHEGRVVNDSPEMVSAFVHAALAFD
jgi:hypothetical protein